MKKKLFILLLASIIAFHTALPMGTSHSLTQKNGTDIFEVLKNSVSYGKNQQELKNLFCKTSDQFIQLRRQKMREAQWVPGGTKNHFFVQKLKLNPEIGETPDIKFVTDIHGHAQPLFDLINSLEKSNWIDRENPFKIKKKNGYIVFLGDYVDRHAHGVQVLLAIMLLYINNPGQVIILRGNHEDVQLNAHYGFFQQMMFHAFDQQDIEKIQQIYNLLPSACYLTWADTKQKNCILCTHGGPNIGYSPKKLLASKATHECLEKPSALSEENFYKKIDKNLTTKSTKKELAQNFDALCAYLGDSINCDLFSWTDFHANPESTLEIHRGRGPKLSKSILMDYLNTTSPPDMRIVGVVRGHQHGEFSAQLKNGNGAYILWQNKIFDDPLALETISNQEPFVITLDGFGTTKGHKNVVLTLKLDDNPEKNLLSLQTINTANSIFKHYATAGWQRLRSSMPF